MADPDELYLTHTIDDDGVYLVCAVCAEAINLGQWPTVAGAQRDAEAHVHLGDGETHAYRSTDLGKTWERVEVHPQSPLAPILSRMKPGQYFDDGNRSIYRIDQPRKKRKPNLREIEES